MTATQIKLGLLDACLALYRQQYQSVTSLDFKNYMRSQHPSENWTQELVSDYLMNLNLPYSDNGSWRIYSFVPIKAQVDETTILNAVRVLTTGQLDITKTNIKSHLRLAGLDISNFSEVFDKMNFVHTGGYTSDNHKVYVLVNSGAHFSQSKKQQVPIREMAKPYLKNAIVKNFNGADIEEVLDDPNDELYQMLFAYFTFEIRARINDELA